jgi:predicted nucleotidyltransferase
MVRLQRDEEDTRSDIDLMIVGSIAMTRFLPVLRRLEQRFDREVNLTRYSLGRGLRQSPNWRSFPQSALKG